MFRALYFWFLCRETWFLLLPLPLFRLPLYQFLSLSFFHCFSHTQFQFLVPSLGSSSLTSQAPVISLWSSALRDTWGSVVNVAPRQISQEVLALVSSPVKCEKAVWATGWKGWFCKMTHRCQSLLFNKVFCVPFLSKFSLAMTIVLICLKIQNVTGHGGLYL